VAVWVENSQTARPNFRFSILPAGEITLGDEYLSQIFPDHKVLWITLKHLSRSSFDFSYLIVTVTKHIQLNICVLLWGQNQLLIPFGRGKARNSSKISLESLPKSHRIDQKRRQNISESYIKNMLKAFSWNTNFMSNLHFRKMPFYE